MFYFQFIISHSTNPLNYTQKKYDYKINKKYADYLANHEEYAIIPGLNEDIIPQGLTYSAKYNKFIVTGYHKGKAASVLFIIDYDSKMLEKTLLLQHNDNQPFNTHIGGLTNNNETLWLSDDYKIYTLEMEELINAENMSFIKVSKAIETFVKGDNITYHNNTLWVGEYDYKIKYKTKKSHYYTTPNNYKNKSLIIGFDISENIDFNNPKYIISVPDRIQGLTFDENNNIILSRSFWSFQPSNISTYKNPLDTQPSLIKINDMEHCIWYLDNTNLISDLELPPMSEGIVYLNGDLYVIFESASSYYKIYTNDKIDSIIKLKKW